MSLVVVNSVNLYGLNMHNEVKHSQPCLTISELFVIVKSASKNNQFLITNFMLTIWFVLPRERILHGCYIRLFGSQPSSTAAHDLYHGAGISIIQQPTNENPGIYPSHWLNITPLSNLNKSIHLPVYTSLAHKVSPQSMHSHTMTTWVVFFLVLDRHSGKNLSPWVNQTSTRLHKSRSSRSELEFDLGNFV